MEFGKKKTINPLELSEELPKQLYPTEKPEERGRDYLVLNQLCEVFKNRAETHSETPNANFTCYIERMAFDAFVRYANDIYKERGHEATGIIVGYYLHDKDNPEATFIVGTNFLKATGPTTRVTCEFSYEDSIRHSNYCDEHKVLPLIWIHSHPGFGAFYSGTDDSTLKTYYYAPYQVGVVVDNLQSQILGYKMYGDNKRQEIVYIFDLDKSNPSHLHLVYENHVRNMKPLKVVQKTVTEAESVPDIETYESKEVNENDTETFEGSSRNNDSDEANIEKKSIVDTINEQETSEETEKKTNDEKTINGDNSNPQGSSMGTIEPEKGKQPKNLLSIIALIVSLFSLLIILVHPFSSMKKTEDMDFQTSLIMQTVENSNLALDSIKSDIDLLKKTMDSFSTSILSTCPQNDSLSN